MANKDSDGFFPAVYEVVRQIPRGRVISYGQIARLLGFPRAARQVGWAMRCCRMISRGSVWSRTAARSRAADTPSSGVYCLRTRV